MLRGFFRAIGVVLGFLPSATSLFVELRGGVAFFCEGVGVLWLACIRRILMCCTVSC